MDWSFLWWWVVGLKCFLFNNHTFVESFRWLFLLGWFLLKFGLFYPNLDCFISPKCLNSYFPKISNMSSKSDKCTIIINPEPIKFFSPGFFAPVAYSFLFGALLTASRGYCVPLCLCFLSDFVLVVAIILSCTVVHSNRATIRFISNSWGVLLLVILIWMWILNIRGRNFWWEFQ